MRKLKVDIFKKTSDNLVLALGSIIKLLVISVKSVINFFIAGFHRTCSLFNTLGKGMKNDAHNHGTIQTIACFFQIIASIVAVFTLWLNNKTLGEMQLERDNAYRPSLYFSDVQYMLESDRWIISNETPELNNYIVYSMQRDHNNFFIMPSINLELSNIGVGTAKDIEISITEEQAQNAINIFNANSKYCKINYIKGVHGYSVLYNNEQYDVGNSTIFEDAFNCSEYYEFFQYWGNTTQYSYLLPASTQSQCTTYTLPTIYYNLLNAMRIELEMEYYDPFYFFNPIPDVEVTVSYSDVQGKRYTEQMVIHTEMHFYYYNWAFSCSIMEKSQSERMIYNNAESNYLEGNYEEAIKYLSLIPDYSLTSELLKECRRASESRKNLIIQEDFNANQEETLTHLPEDAVG